MKMSDNHCEDKV